MRGAGLPAWLKENPGCVDRSLHPVSPSLYLPPSLHLHSLNLSVSPLLLPVWLHLPSLNLSASPLPLPVCVSPPVTCLSAFPLPLPVCLPSCYPSVSPLLLPVCLHLPSLYLSASPLLLPVCLPSMYLPPRTSIHPSLLPVGQSEERAEGSSSGGTCPGESSVAPHPGPGGQSSSHSAPC